MPYSKKIEELRAIAEKSYEALQEVLANERWSEEDAARKRHDRNVILKWDAHICNTILNNLKRDSDESGLSVSEIIDSAISQNSFSVEDMETFFRFGPEWGNLLTNGPKSSSLYQLEIIDKRNGEVYYKVGHTSGNVKNRMRGLGICKRTFDVTVHHTILFREKWCAEAEEKRLHARNAELRYVGTPFLSNGHTEVYMQPLLSHRLKLELCLYSLLGVARY